MKNGWFTRMDATGMVDARQGVTAMAFGVPVGAHSQDGTADGVGVMGRVRIAREVLRTVVREAALAVPGVARLAPVASAWAQLLGRPRPREGVGLTVRGTIVGVDLYLIVEPGVNMVTLGEAVQDSVGAAIEHILGMEVSEINVYVRDVA